MPMAVNSLDSLSEVNPWISEKENPDLHRQIRILQSSIHFLSGSCCQLGIDLIRQNVLRYCSNGLIHDFTIFDEEYGRDVPYAIFHSELLVVVYIHFPDHGTVSIFVGDFFNERSYHSARSTPFGPEVYHHRLVGAHHFFEIRVIDLYCHFVLYLSSLFSNLFAGCSSVTHKRMYALFDRTITLPYPTS